MSGVVQAGLWGLVAGSVLLLGAGACHALRVPARVVAVVMAFGVGVLLSAVSFELMGGSIPAGRGGARGLRDAGRRGGVHRRQRLAGTPRRPAP